MFKPQLLSCLFLIALFQSKLNAQSLNFEHLTTYDGLSQNSVLCIAQDYQGFMWFGTAYGVNRYDGKTFKKYNSSVSDSNSISNDYINCLLADSKQTLWVGTARGLNKLDLKTNKVERIAVSGSATGLSSLEIRCLYEDRSGNIWVGTSNGLNLLLDRSANTFTKFYADNSRGIAGNLVRCIFEDDENSLWVGTSNGLTRMTRRSETYQFETFRHEQDNLASLSSDIISAINQDAAHNLLVGTPNAGLNVFNKANQTFTRVDMKKVRSNTVRAIERTHDDKLWIGTLDGLFVFDPISGKDTLYQHFSSQPRSLNQNSVYSIFHDAAGSLWVGTYFGGISVAHLINNVFSSWRNNNTQHSISNDVVSGITLDNSENIWISTDIGLCRLRPVDSLVTTFDPDEGIVVGGSVRNAVYKSASGELFFGGQGGFISFFPDKIQINQNIAPVLFTSLRLSNDATDVPVDGKLLTQDISLTDEITLQHNQSVFTISFALLNFIKSLRNTYAYKLEGLDEDWNFSDNNFLTYTRLPAGQYTLLVKGCNSDGTWSKPMSLKIRVLPAAWQTWWAYATYSGILIVIGMLVMRTFYSSRLRRMKPENAA